MATRTNDLTEFAKPVADKLAARCGSLKKVLSAGIMAFDSLSPNAREHFMAMADGEEVESLQDAEEVFRHKGLEIVKASQKIPAKRKSSHKTKPSKAG